MITSAERFGFKVYYGDACRLDVLHASGAGQARAIAVCTDSREAADRVVELARHAFPQARLLVRAYDREHARQLVGAGVDVQVRETFESALVFGERALRSLGVPDDEARGLIEEVRERDAERFALEVAAGSGLAGRELLYGNLAARGERMLPAPLVRPQREGSLLNPEALAQSAEPPRHDG